MEDKNFKKEVARLRSEIRKTQQKLEIKKETNPFTGLVSGNYWTQTGMPWVSSEGRKAVLTEWFWQPIRGQPRRVDTNELRQFSQTFWIHSCVTTICDEVSGMEWDIKPMENWDYESLKEQINEVKDFMEYPNKNRESFTTIIRALIKDILELDAGVLIKVFDINSYDFDAIEPKSGAPLLKDKEHRKMVELYARDGSSFLKEVDKFGFTKGYWQYSYQIPAHPMWFNKEEVCYLMRNQRSMSCYGFAPVQAILDIVKSLHYSTLYNRRFFEETAIPDGVLSILDTNETEMKNFLDNWTREFKAQPHKFAVVNKDIKWAPLTALQRELEFLETQNWYYKMVISAFGLTPAELGITDDVNRSTSSTQAELSKRKGIRPLLKILEKYINEDIISEFGYEGIEFQFIYDDPTEKNQRLTNWQLELNMGIKTSNEIRNELGLEPVEGGDLTRQQQAQVQVNNYGYPEREEGVGAQETEPEERKEGNEKDRQEMHRAEGELQRKQSLRNPFAPSNRPVGEFKESKINISKGKYKTMPLKELIEEHKKLIRVLEEGSDEKIKEETKKQKEELESYMREAEKTEKATLSEIHDALTREGKGKDPWALAQWIYQRYHKSEELKKKNEKGIDDGQYYHEGFEVIKPPKHNKIVQPQNKREQNRLINERRQEKPQGNVIEDSKNKIVCPYCGHPTLSEESNLDTMMGAERRWRCAFCFAYLTQQELIDNKVLESTTQTMQANPSTSAVNIPNWSPKGLNKSIDLNMKCKEFIGFDYIKSYGEILDYVKSEKYEKLLKGYLDDLSAKKVDKIIKILEEGLEKGLGIGEIARQIDKILHDFERSQKIARTEIIRVANEGQRIKLKNKGVKRYIWISAQEDGRLCKKCKKLDNQKFNIDKGPRPPLHVNCRCSISEYVQV